MAAAGVELIAPLSCQFMPDEGELKKFYEAGKAFAERL